MSDFFLWGGFVFTLLWHGISWAVFRVLYRSDDELEALARVSTESLATNLGLSGVALCGFGYLAFGTI